LKDRKRDKKNLNKEQKRNRICISRFDNIRIEGNQLASKAKGFLLHIGLFFFNTTQKKLNLTKKSTQQIIIKNNKNTKKIS